MSQSIHPRVVNGRTTHDKVNTCKRGAPPHKIIDRYDQRINAHAATLASLTSADNPAGWRKPGSRNPKKLRNR